MKEKTTHENQTWPEHIKPQSALMCSSKAKEKQQRFKPDKINDLQTYRSQITNF